MIDHLSLGVDNVENAMSFYNGLLETLGYTCMVSNEALAAYGRNRIEFILIRPNDGGAASVGNGTHICFKADTKEAVDAFHKFAMENGGTCAGEPGPRPAYPIPDVYTTFILDPFGHKLEAINGGFAA
ncbi:VOC family protein [Kordiimonas sp. SCSIO 12603]|uniref:VOC family protein n=1 Tax=Kordiimonas sp. SCSIO 12603 TaxID=2829596 RepID=UPI002102D9A6|nr:VOC family protein [Kordiimonas sp. SCSIO 12603]UTW58358.1 VOC family protein [Kordiimonas sp. SCSIO 12603]